MPADAPTAFIKPRWKPLVITPEGLDRKFWNCRPVRAEERPALRRHLGQGLAAVPRLRRLPAAGREVRRTQARAGPALGDQPEQRPVQLEERLQLLDSSWPPSPAWPRTTSCPMPSSPSQG
ncbi:hypothetical protein ACLB1O_31645 [Escherichia coli]